MRERHVKLRLDRNPKREVSLLLFQGLRKPAETAEGDYERILEEIKVEVLRKQFSSSSCAPPLPRHTHTPTETERELSSCRNIFASNQLGGCSHAFRSYSSMMPSIKENEG